MVKNRGRFDLLALNGYVALISAFFVYCFLSFGAAKALPVVENFDSLESATTGTLVSIQRDKTESVEFASFSNDQYLVGVVANKQQSAITFTRGTSELYVATSGEVEMLVSNANGEVREGDFIAVSWLEGVGMKALSEGQEFVAIALEDYSAQDAQEYGQIETGFGDRDVSIDSIQVRLIPNSEQNIADSRADNSSFTAFGRTISSSRVLAAAILFGLGLVIAGLFVFASIRGSFISLGRNPLASKSINRGMLRVAIASVIIIFVSTASAYLVVTL